MPARWELALDGCARPTVGPRRWGAYFVCGFTGYLAGLALVTVLGARADLTLATRLVLAMGPPVALLFAIKASQIVFGYERIVFYEKAIAAVGTTVGAAAIAGGPVEVVLDLATLGVGTFLAFGRIGCFRVGCCHGRRARRGVAYSDDHARAGFPARWVGCRLLPIQLIEAVVVIALVAGGVAVIVAGAAPGTAACAFACGYGVVRFALELLRGDPVRPIGGGVSEAQWTAVITTAAAATYRPAWWTIATAGLLAAAALALVIARRADRWPSLWLAAAHHAHEVAAAVERGTPTLTREGVKVSVAPLADGRVDVILSRPDRRFPLAAARRLAAQQSGTWLTIDVVAGRAPGLYHLVATPRDGRAA